MKNGAPFISIVAPVYNEEEGIEKFLEEVMKVIKKIDKPYEIVFVNDGSKDKSLEKLKAMAAKNKNIKVLSFSRNFGHQIAITAGMDAANGDVVVTIDADLQDTPQLILKMLKKWQEGYEVVYAKRKKRKDTFFKKLTASMFYRTLNKLSEVDIPLDTGDYRLMDRKVIEAMKQVREHSRFIRGLTTWVGFKQTPVEFDRGERFAGETHYPLKKMLKLAMDGMLAFSYKPLKLATWLGFLSIVAGLIFAVYVIILKIVEPSHVTQGWPTLVILVLFMGGVQLFVLGAIGEYIGRIYTEEQNRPLYIVSEKINF